MSGASSGPAQFHIRPPITAVVALAAIRLGLALGGLGAAIAAGASRQAAALGWLLGVVAGGVFVLTDPRSRLLRLQPAKPRVEPWWKAALRATYPSTLGVALFAAVSLAFSPVLAAVLAGIVGGLGVAGLLAALALRT